ncbi:MAG: hypothetical protein JWM78_472, partial [Verrucomicrobiaceae bacterium]|nr:hypothetical protein [Verrucomicrobiaceae bacterium]
VLFIDGVFIIDSGGIDRRNYAGVARIETRSD